MKRKPCKNPLQQQKETPFDLIYRRASKIWKMQTDLDEPQTQNKEKAENDEATAHK